MKTLEEVKSQLLEYKPQLSSKYPIKSMAIFGSFARNEQNVSSDLDLMVEFSDEIGIRFIDLAEELRNISD